MTTINMNASISDIFEFAGEWTPATGYDGAEAYERLKALSDASEKADEAYFKELDELEEFRLELMAKREAGTATDDDEYAYYDSCKVMRCASPDDYMELVSEYQYTDYIRPDRRI